jgi:dsDNA-specific endonuclease/ATPase MutS2
MDKKFKNLSTEYKKYLTQVEKILKNYDQKKELSFKEINDLYNRINDINIQLLIVEKDIYNLFYNFDGNNETINKLKNLVENRNKEIIRKLLESSIYKNYITKLQSIYKKSEREIKDAFFKLLKKYSMSWKCCWSFLDMDEHATIKKIELFDVNDIKLFTN